MAANRSDEIKAVFDRFAEGACGQWASAQAKKEFIGAFAACLGPCGVSRDYIWSLYAFLTNDFTGRKKAIDGFCSKNRGYDRALLLKAADAAKALDEEIKRTDEHADSRFVEALGAICRGIFGWQAARAFLAFVRKRMARVVDGGAAPVPAHEFITRCSEAEQRVVAGEFLAATHGEYAELNADIIVRAIRKAREAGTGGGAHARKTALQETGTLTVIAEKWKRMPAPALAGGLPRNAHLHGVQPPRRALIL